MRPLLTILILLLALPSLRAQHERPDKRQLRDMVLLKDGSYLRGIVSDITPDTIYLDMPMGHTLAIARHQIRKLMVRGRRVDLGKEHRPGSAEALPLEVEGVRPEPLPMPRGTALQAAIGLLPGLDAEGHFSMGGTSELGWRRHPRHGPGLGLVAGISKYDYSDPSFVTLSGELSLALPKTRWRLGAAAGMSMPFVLSSRRDLESRRLGLTGRAWVGRLLYTDAQLHPMVLQAGIRWQQAHYSLRTTTEFQIVDATFLRYELRLVMLAFASKRKKRR